MKLIALVCLSALLSFSESGINYKEFPIPPYSKKSLFYIHRSPNPNTVIYEVNLTDENTIDPKDPVRIYWIRYGEKNKYRDLNYLERTFAYGIKSESIGNDKYDIQFVASKEKSFVAALDDKGQAYAMMKISGKDSKLKRIFVQVAEDGWWPRVAYVEFFGTDLETDKPTYEKMLIK
jgi:hypothetical protein